jgi:hypothetical protein
LAYTSCGISATGWSFTSGEFMIAMASLAAALTIGFLLVRALLPELEGARAMLFLAGCGAAVGFGIDSLLFFVLTMAGAAGPLWFALEQALMLAAALWLYWQRARRTARHESKPTRRRLPRAATIAGMVFSAELVLLLVSFSGISRVDPHGAWDAWSIWNLRARYLAGGQATWRYAVSKYIILQHPDYPLLTSSLTAHAWVNSGSIGASVPIAVALVFMLATVLVLVAGLVWSRGVMPGLCAGVMLLAAPEWFKLGAAQYADIPLGFYFLVTLALLCAGRHDGRFALLAGFTASLSAWTKDEGLMFTGACVVVTLVLCGAKRAAMVLAGALPVVLFLAWFKLRIAPGLDPMWRQGAGVMLAKLSAGGRYATIAAQFAKHASAIRELALLPLFGLALGFKLNRATMGCFVVVGLMLVGFFGVYLVSPYPLEWHLESSLDRLYIQLLPAFLFGWFRAGTMRRYGTSDTIRS